MSVIASIHGRLAFDPDGRETKNGKPMTLGKLAVDVTGNNSDGEPETLWVSLMAFGHGAETLARAAKGEMVSAMGKLTRGKYTKAGEERESWSMLADNVVTVRSARPGQRRPNDRRPARPMAGDPYDDEIRF